MPDITMCNDHDCPYKMDCWRFIALESKYQSWFTESPRRGHSCEMFMQYEDEPQPVWKCFDEPEQISLFAAGTLLALCIIGMAIIVVVCAIF